MSARHRSRVKRIAACLRNAGTGYDRQRMHQRSGSVLTWVARNAAPISSLAIPASARRILGAATTNADGKRAAAGTARRHTTILANALDYARELKVIDVESNPIRALKQTSPKTSLAVDRRSAVNPRQARASLPPSGLRNRAAPGS